MAEVPDLNRLLDLQIEHVSALGKGTEVELRSCVELRV